MKLLIFLLLIFSISSNAFGQVIKTRYASSIILKADPSDANSITIVSPSPSTNTSIQFPSALGAASSYLATDGTGALSWQSISGSGVPNGIDGSIQFNDNSSMDGDSLFVFIDSTNNLFVGISPSSINSGSVNTPTATIGKNTVQGRISVRSNGSSYYMILAADSSMTADLVFEMPAVNGEAMEALVTDGAGELSWGGNVNIGPISEDDPDGSNNDINNNPDYAYMGGGQNNDISNNPENVSIYGGDDNDINNNADGSTIIGGTGNDLNNQNSYSFLFGGESIDINNNAQSSGVAAGYDNNISNQTNYSVILAGNENDINNNSDASVMYGGSQNDFNNSDADYSAILGGESQDLQQSRNAILGGYDNSFSNNSSDDNIFFGGESNGFNNAPYGAILAGTNNDIADDYGVILSGNNNYVNKDYSGILYGNNNDVQNQADYSIIGGEEISTKRDYSVALGRNINPNNHDGIVIFTDANTSDISTGTDNEWRCRFSNGYRLFTNSSLTAGVLMNAGATSWSSVSDSTKKHLILELNYRDIYSKIPELGIYSWNYIGSNPSIRNYSPMAQDFFRLFGNDELGNIGTDSTIAELHLTSIFLAGVKGAQLEAEDTNTKLSALQRNSNAIKSRIDKIRSRLDRLKETK